MLPRSLPPTARSSLSCTPLCISNLGLRSYASSPPPIPKTKYTSQSSTRPARPRIASSTDNWASEHPELFLSRPGAKTGVKPPGWDPERDGKDPRTQDEVLTDGIISFLRSKRGINIIFASTIAYVILFPSPRDGGTVRNEKDCVLLIVGFCFSPFRSAPRLILALAIWEKFYTPNYSAGAKMVRMEKARQRARERAAEAEAV
jgi:hypothetical protein